MRVLIALALSLVATESFAAPGRKEPPKNEVPLVGTWEVVGLTTVGTVIEIQAEGLRLEFNADATYRRLRRGQPTAEVGSFTVDPKADPPTIDLEVTREGKPFTTYLGIYRVADDTLTLALAPKTEDRPTKFESVKGESVVLWVCKRVKTKD
jgi:uncharacterized protein (TIGR03067 family)